MNANMQTEPMKMRKRIGSTVYLINIFVKNDAAETIDDKLFRLMKKDLNMTTGRGTMELPQTVRLPERSSA